jgi:hydrogenase/urease accessory protein HupE
MYRLFLPFALFLWGLYLLYEGLRHAQETGRESEWQWGVGFMVIGVVLGVLRYLRMRKTG